MNAEQLRKLLARLGLSQRGAAKLLDIDERTMRRYVSGKGSIPKAVELALLGMKGGTIIADMAKMLELQQKSEAVVIDMIAVAVKAEREACAKVCDGWSKRDDDVGGFIGRAIRARGES